MRRGVGQVVHKEDLLGSWVVGGWIFPTEPVVVPEQRWTVRRLTEDIPAGKG